MGDAYQRHFYFENSIDAEVLAVSKLSHAWLWQRTGLNAQRIALVQEAFQRRFQHDYIVTWGERFTMLLALAYQMEDMAQIAHLMKNQSENGENKRAKHVAMMYWFSKKNVALPLQALQKHIDHIITWNSYQHQYAIKNLQIPPEKMTLVKYPIDQAFWEAGILGLDSASCETICSAGFEMRDYPTLLKALDPLKIKCHLAADSVRIVGGPVSYRQYLSPNMTQNPLVTIGRLSAIQLRELYAKSRFIIVPLYQTDTDNGITTILQAMFMGKAVICSRTIGQVDVIEDGVTGIFVPPNDPIALREAIVDLWENPAKADQIGKAAQNYVRQHHSIEKFAGAVQGVLRSLE